MEQSESCFQMMSDMRWLECGSNRYLRFRLIDIVAELVKVGILDKSGRILDPSECDELPSSFGTGFETEVLMAEVVMNLWLRIVGKPTSPLS